MARHPTWLRSLLAVDCSVKPVYVDPANRLTGTAGLLHCLLHCFLRTHLAHQGIAWYYGLLEAALFNAAKEELLLRGALRVQHHDAAQLRHGLYL